LLLPLFEFELVLESDSALELLELFAAAAAVFFLDCCMAIWNARLNSTERFGGAGAGTVALGAGAVATGFGGGGTGALEAKAVRRSARVIVLGASGVSSSSDELLFAELLLSSRGDAAAARAAFRCARVIGLEVGCATTSSSGEEELFAVVLAERLLSSKGGG
jgi:hypothetical protein